MMCSQVFALNRPGVVPCGARTGEFRFSEGEANARVLTGISLEEWEFKFRVKINFSKFNPYGTPTKSLLIQLVQPPNTRIFIFKPRQLHTRK